MATFEEQLETDLPLFVNVNDFAIEASFNGVLVQGIFDSGIEGDREPRSPMFTCIDSDVADVQHGDSVLIDWTPYEVELTGVIAYTVEGYQPDGVGMASIILKVDRDIGQIQVLSIQTLSHARYLDAIDVFIAEFTIDVDSMRHGHELTELLGLGLIEALIDASQDQVTKTGNQVSSIIATDGQQYDVQGGTGVLHDAAQSPTGLPVYSFDGTIGSYFNRLIAASVGQPFTAFIVVRKSNADDMTLFDNQ